MSVDDDPSAETPAPEPPGTATPTPTAGPGHAGLLVAPRYHELLRDHLRTTEPELWAWFAESALPSRESIQEAEVDLLKTAYRLDGGLHDVLTAYASLAAGQLDLPGNITLYQELGTQERNARVLILGDDVHIVFGGDLLDLLDLGEQQAVLAHELAHVALWQRDERAFWILDQLVHRLAADPAASEAVDETARRLRLHTEVFADAIAVEVTGNRDDVIASVVKVHSGLRIVDPAAYLRQARQILEADPSSSRGWTHPELHVRVGCLAARSSANAEALIDGLIEGPDELDRVDVLGQLRLQDLAGQVLASGQRAVMADPSATSSADEIDDDVELHIETFPLAVQASTGELADDALTSLEPSVRHFCGALLVDVALAPSGRTTEIAHIAPVAREADRLGIANEFDKILARATDRSMRDIRKLHAGREDVS